MTEVMLTPCSNEHCCVGAADPMQGRSLPSVLPTGACSGQFLLLSPLFRSTPGLNSQAQEGTHLLPQNPPAPQPSSAYPVQFKAQRDQGLRSCGEITRHLGARKKMPCRRLLHAPNQAAGVALSLRAYLSAEICSASNFPCFQEKHFKQTLVCNPNVSASVCSGRGCKCL